MASGSNDQKIITHYKQGGSTPAPTAQTSHGQTVTTHYPPQRHTRRQEENRRLRDEQREDQSLSGRILKGIRDTRDDIYGYRNTKSKKTGRERKTKSDVGNINFFPSGPLFPQPPSSKNSAPRGGRSRSSRSDNLFDPGYIPDSLRDLF